MSDINTNNLMEQLSQMLKSDTVPDELKNIFNGLNSNTSDNSSKQENGSTNSSPDIDMETLLKMKQILNSMNSNKDDPRTNLLISLKPYLKESRQKKIDQYIKLFGIGKAFEMLGSLGGDDKHDAK